jgi:ribosomal protein L17
MTRTTEQKATKVIAELIAKLTALTTNQPTTAEIEEALLMNKAVTRALFEWLASRYATKAREA